MDWDRGLYIVLSGALVAGVAFAQTSNKPSTADQRRHRFVGRAGRWRGLRSDQQQTIYG